MLVKISKLYVYLVFGAVSFIMLLMCFSVLPFSKILFLIDFCITLTIIVSELILVKNYMEFILSSSKTINLFLNENSNKILSLMPVPVAIISDDSGENIVSYNSVFKDKFLGGEDFFKGSIKEFLPPSFSKSALFETGVQISFGDKKFMAHCRKIDNFTVFYFFENTDYKNLKKKYLESKVCVGIAIFDNKEELYQIVGEDRGLSLLVSVENVLAQWMSSAGGIFKKLSDGKYMLIFEEKCLRYFISSKFEIINKIHEIKIDPHRFATVSLGISRNSKNLEQAKLCAENALTMALGRGGDQVALKSESGYEFFGGSSKGLEKRSKVRTRVVAMALLEKIQACDSIFVMGHKLSDFDSVGASIGLWSACLRIGKKPSYIVLNSEASMASPLIETMNRFGYSGSVISPQEAMQKVTKNSFLIVVDTHAESFLESYKLYCMFTHTAIIDHHRMTVDKIKASDIFFHEPFASSTCEMVTELVQYMDDKHLKKWEAECLLAGIMLDTKSFSLKSGVRTFEAAAYLKKKGADSAEVKKMFADSIDVYKIKCKIIESTYVIKNCAIAKCEENKSATRISCVQAADELLDIKEIRASFVIFKSENGVNVSARSLGDVNVQVIMESLGGGGHQTMAAAHVPGATIDEVEEKLKEFININL